MRLFELKALFKSIESKFSEFTHKGNLNQIEEDLKIQFKVQNIDDLPKELMTAYYDYKKALTRFTLIVESMNSLIQKYSNTEAGDEIEIDVDIQEIVKWYELINRCYINFNFSKHLTERNQNFSQKLFFETENASCILLSTSDFSDQFMQCMNHQINNILITMSGDFNNAEVNKQLGKLTLGTIDNNYLSSQFGKDGNSSYFFNQQVATIGRSDNDDLGVQKKAEDFVLDFFKKSNFPIAFKPNLKGLVSTLTNQGSILGFPVTLFASHISIHNLFSIGGCGFGAGALLNFNFNHKNQLEIEYLYKADKIGDLSGNRIENVKIFIKMNFIIDIKMINEKIKFTLNNTAVSFYSSLPKSTPMLVASTLVKESDSIPPQHRLTSAIIMKHLTDYLNYATLDEFYLNKGPKTSELDLYNFFDLAHNKSPDGKILSFEEYKFFTYILQNDIADRNQIAKQICQFVYHQLNSNKVDAKREARYMIWLNMAAEISGSKLCWKNAKIDSAFLCKTFRETPNILIQLAQDDAELYQEMVFPEGFFDSAIKLSDKDHALLLAKHNILLTGQRSANFVKQITQFNPSIKLLFIVKFIKYGNDLVTLNLLCEDLFDKKLIQWVNESAQKRNYQVTEVLTQLITDAPIETLQLMRQKYKKAFLICYNRISNDTVENVIQFIGNMADSKICQRLGIEFLKTLLEKLSRWLEFGDLNECTMVLTCAEHLGRLLAKDPNLYDNDAFIAISTQINTIVRLAQMKLINENKINVPISSDESPVITSESIVAAPEKVEIDDDSSTTDEEELEAILSDAAQSNFSQMVLEKKKTNEKIVVMEKMREDVVTSGSLVAVSAEDEKPTRLTKEVTIDTDLDTTTPSVIHVTSLLTNNC